MDFLRGLMPGGDKSAAAGGAGGAAGGNTSLLSDWQQYAGGGDVEAGGAAAAGGAGAGGGGAAAAAAGSLYARLVSSYQSVADGVGGLSTGATSSLDSLPSGQQLVYFFSFLGGGLLFLFFAFFIGLPTLLLSPSKFALFFTLGCCFILAGFAALKGWRAQLGHMLQRERLPFSLGYVGSIVLTLYAALVMKSYVLSLGCSALQVVALAYYLTSYYPGGTSSVRFVLGMFGSAASSCASSVWALLVK